MERGTCAPPARPTRGDRLAGGREPVPVTEPPPASLLLLASFTDRYADTRIQETGRTIIGHRYIGRVYIHAFYYTGRSEPTPPTQGE